MTSGSEGRGADGADADVPNAGLALMRSMIAGELPPPSMVETIPLRFTCAEHGRVEGEARADARHLNPMGGVHGGFAATVLDSLTGCAVHSTLEHGDLYGTIDLSVRMLRPLPRDVWLRATGETLHVSRTLGVAEGRLLDAEGRLLAHATASCLIRRAPRPGD